MALSPHTLSLGQGNWERGEVGGEGQYSRRSTFAGDFAAICLESIISSGDQSRAAFSANHAKPLLLF